MADPVRPLVAIAGAEALAALALTAVVGLGAVRSDLGALIAATTVVMWVLIVGALGLIWNGLRRRRRAARTPFLLTQAFAIVVAWPWTSSDLLVYRTAGLILAVAAVAGLAAGLRPSVREQLG
jgi:hypothetical protein